MTHRDIRAHLRGAVKAGVLRGWYWHGGGGEYAPIRYVVHPGERVISTFSTEETVEYCEMLRAAGVEPLYRNAEPIG